MAPAGPESVSCAFLTRGALVRNSLARGRPTSKFNFLGSLSDCESLIQHNLRVLTVVGARPQFIKAGPVSEAFRVAQVSEIVVHTGQHYDANMSGLFFEELGLSPPAINLGVGSGSHATQTAGILRGLEPVFEAEKPDCVLLYGDTNSTLAGALVASKLQIPLAHVEAGLRSFNRRMPEEINRIIADSLSDLLFAPTIAAEENLKKEGISASRIKKVGDVMLDAAMMHSRRALSNSRILQTQGLEGLAFILATIHRAENTDDGYRLGNIASALAEINREIPVVFPLHPRTRNALTEHGLLERLSKCRLIAPLGFLDMVLLESSAAVIVTDSGGVQKEAFFHATPCVTIREETEWVELVELGWNRLCPAVDSGAIVRAVLSAIGTRGQTAKPYGDGKASTRIVDVLQAALTH
jgi:UDP-GlcNAc3NAcA epimerase